MIKQVLSFPYQLAHAMRSTLYDLGIFKQKKLPAYTISVGNLSFGGTGKTPVVIAIAKYLAKQGLKVAVLSRGYKGRGRNYPIFADASSKVEEIGDEPMEMLNAFAGSDIRLTVDPNRYRGGIKTSQKYPVDVFILDDGMQHLAIARDSEIVLKNTNESGFMREFPFAEAKADQLIYTKVSDEWIENNQKAKNPKNFVKFNLSLTKKLHPENSLGVFTGVADPNSVLRLIKKELLGQGFQAKDLESIEQRFFPDHHYFSVGEVKEVLALGINIITTAKDLVKIPGEYQDQFVVAKLVLDFYPNSFISDLQKGVKHD
ncbi:MAG: tetraacyldisaccharide 4'-kinase [Candidatus Melainabacteria bacterium]|jgi:tetraacyldisaccharide 4'-kinase|nr:tetraacyldisaccharide 4'-kinase [Candidatus Melainabacteria bacterium]